MAWNLPKRGVFEKIHIWGLARRNARSAWNPPPLPYGKRWRVESKPQVRNCKSQICRSLTPLKSPPTAPAHSARPLQKMHRPGFCDFHFARHSPSEMQKNYPRWNLIRICIKNAICKTAFWWNFSSDAFCFHIFTKMCSPLPPEAHFWKTMLS